MKCFPLPRWSIGLVALGVTIGLVACTHPGGWMAACHDLWETPELQEQLQEEQVRQRELNQRSGVILERLLLKEMLVKDWVEGKRTFESVVGQFRELNAREPKILLVMRQRYGDLTDAELAELSVRFIAECQLNVRSDPSARVEAP